MINMAYIGLVVSTFLYVFVVLSFLRQYRNTIRWYDYTTDEWGNITGTKRFKRNLDTRELLILNAKVKAAHWKINELTHSDWELIVKAFNENDMLIMRMENTLLGQAGHPAHPTYDDINYKIGDMEFDICCFLFPESFSND